MLVTIYCRVLLYRVLLYSILLYSILLYSILLYRVLLYSIFLSSHLLWIKNKLHHQNISKSKVLSLIHCHGPSTWATPSRGVVNPWQTKSGAQCWAYGQWIGPFTYWCDAEQLHDITSHPAIKQYQQLAYVGWQVANTKSHTKMVSFHKKTAVNICHTQCSRQADTWQCVNPSHTSLVQGTGCWRTLHKYQCEMP